MREGDTGGVMLEPELCGDCDGSLAEVGGCAKMREVWLFWLTPRCRRWFLMFDVSLRVMPVFGRIEIAKHKRQSITGHGSIPHLQLPSLTFSLSHFLLSATIIVLRCFSTTGERLS